MPFAYDAQIASSADVVREVLRSTEVPSLDPARLIIFSGIGTSLHAARVAAEWVNRLTSGAIRPNAIDAHDLGTVQPILPSDQIVVISHRGYKIFPNAALRRARAAGASTIAVVGKVAPEQPADYTIRTCDNESAGTFSVSYLASLAVLAKLACRFETHPDRPFERALPDVPGTIAKTLASGMSEDLVARLAERQPLLFFAFGLDFYTVQEAALKVKEGAWRWTEAMSVEFALHGTPASYRSEMGAVIVQPIEDDQGRSRLLKQVLNDLGIDVVAISGEEETADFRFFAPHPLLRPFTSILPFHRLTAALARIHGTDPDSMHGRREPWQKVMTGIKL